MCCPLPTEAAEGVDPASQFHLRLAEDRCQRLLEWLDEQDAKLFPTNAPRRLVAVCKAAVSRMLLRLATARGTAATHALGRREYVQRETGSVHDFINGLEYYFLPLLVGAEVATTTGAIPQLLQRLASSLVGDCLLLLKTVPEFNYASGVLTPRLRFLFEAAGCGEVLRDFPQHFCVVYISSFTPNAFLTHTLVAHEIGHIVYAVRDLDTNLSTDLPDDQSGLNNDPAAVAEFKERLADWREEFMCDLLSLCLFGPAYVYAVTGFLSATGGSSGLDAASTHPSPRMRITLMLDAMDGKLGTLGFTQGSVPLLGELRESLGPIQSNELDPADRLAYDLLRSEFPKALTIAESAVREWLYTPAYYRRDAGDLSKRLAFAIPPNEYDDTSEPASFASVLNASWAFYLSEPELAPLGMDHSPEERYERFYGLVSWALETSELVRSWRQIHGSQPR